MRALLRLLGFGTKSPSRPRRATKRVRKAELKPLYARLAGPEVLAHATRATLAEEVRRSPGISLPDLARRVNIATTTATWHVRTLEREGFIVATQDGRVRRFFPPGTSRDTRKKTTALAERSRSRLVEIVRDHPGITQERLADEVGLARATVWHHAKRLERDGLMRSEKDGRERRYFVA